MTALNIRKNLSNFLHATATAVDQARVPELKGIGDALDNARLTIAKAVVPNDKAFVIPKKPAPNPSDIDSAVEQSFDYFNRYVAGDR